MESLESSLLIEETKLRLNKPQWALLGLIIIFSGLLGFATIDSSNISVNQAKVLSQGETRSASVIFSQRETLVYATRLAQWVGGQIPRRDVQIARALLAQRLAVVDQSGTSVGASADPAFLASIKTGDALIESYGPGVLPIKVQESAKAAVAPVINQVLETARTFVSTYQQALDGEVVKTANDRKRADRTSLTYLFILLALLAIFAGWVGYTTRGQYLRSRRAIRREIETLETLHEELAIAQEKVSELRSLNDAKNEFISTVNHELRTPLTSIIGYSDLLKTELTARNEEALEDMLGYVQRNANLLLELVESMLALSKLDSGIVVSYESEIDIRKVIDGALFMLELEAEKKELEIHFVPVIGDNFTVLGNEGQLSQVFINLISNAIKFSPIKGVVEIECSTSDGGRVACISVRDHGIGIPKEDLSKLFHRFFRARNVIHSQIPGTGLGLEIVSRIVTLHKGKVTVDSTEGLGATFTVCLPKPLDPVEKLVIANRHGVLVRAIGLLESAQSEDLETVIHTVAGTLPFYTFEQEGAMAATIENWFRTTHDYEIKELITKRDELLIALKKSLVELESQEVSPNKGAPENVN